MIRARSERGQALVQTVLMLTMLLGMTLVSGNLHTVMKERIE